MRSGSRGVTDLALQHHDILASLLRRLIPLANFGRPEQPVIADESVRQ
jgi:hypothetical protein